MRVLILMVIASIPFITLANDLNTQIDKACLRHAVSLVGQLKTSVISEMDKSQSDKALKIATETCQAYFRKEFETQSDSLAATETQEDEKSTGDWLTDKIISGDAERKEGNKRLDRIRNK